MIASIFDDGVEMAVIPFPPMPSSVIFLAFMYSRTFLVVPLASHAIIKAKG